MFAKKFRFCGNDSNELAIPTAISPRSPCPFRLSFPSLSLGERAAGSLPVASPLTTGR